jgi:hypothetical protein
MAPLVEIQMGCVALLVICREARKLAAGAACATDCIGRDSRSED